MADDMLYGTMARRWVPAGALLFLMLLACTVILAAMISLAVGPREMSAGTILTAFGAFDPDNFDHQALMLFRLPRLQAALLVGGSLGLAGVLMQVVIRNPLAEPQLLGLNSGAALAVVAMSFAGLDAAGVFRPLAAAIGALVTFTVVLMLAGIGKGGATPLKVTLSGVIVSAFASSVTSALLLVDDQALADLRFWLAGDLAGRTGAHIAICTLAIGIAVLAAFLLAPRLAVLSLGNDVARGLGINVKATRIAAVAIAAILCGAAVTLSGPIGFIGLIVPHLVRRVIGQGLRLQFAACLIGGPILLLIADILARQLIAPAEIATGVITGAVGAFFFILIVARYFR